MRLGRESRSGDLSTLSSHSPRRGNEALERSIYCENLVLCGASGIAVNDDVQRDMLGHLKECR